MARGKRMRSTSPPKKEVDDENKKPTSSQKDPNVTRKRAGFKKTTHNEKNRQFFTENFKSKGTNITTLFNQLQKGVCKSSALQKIAEDVFLKNLKKFRIFWGTETPELRATAMQWHPTNPYVLVVGGRSGGVQLFMMNRQKEDPKHFSYNQDGGTGPPHDIEAITFNTKRSGVEICTASKDGTLTAYNFDMNTKVTLVVTEELVSEYFCSVGVHEDGKRVYGGDNKGRLAIHYLDSHETDYITKSLKLHSSKIKHLEFSPRDSNLMITSSLDRTVKLWDVRKLDGSKSYIECLQHDKGVSSAQFSRADGCRLLTSDTNDQLRVYRAPHWTLEHQLLHPHRKLPHMATTRPSWHPRADLFVVGRFPDRKVPQYENLRSVDVFSAATGQLRYELTDSSRLITSLSHFNANGSLLASSCGSTVYVWRSRAIRPS